MIMIDSRIAEDPPSKVASTGTTTRRWPAAAAGVLFLLAWLPIPEPLSADELLRIVESSDERIVIELATGPPESMASPSPGFSRISLPGTGQVRQVGAPRLPVIGALLGVSDGATVIVEGVETGSTTVHTGLLVEPVPRLSISASDGEGVGDEEKRPVEYFEPDPAIYDTEADFPPSLVELGTPLRWRDQEVVPLRIHPVRGSPATGTWKHHGRLRVSLRIDPPPGEPSPGAPVASRRAPSPVFDRILERRVLRPTVTTLPIRRPDPPPALPPALASPSGGGSWRVELGVEADGFYSVSGSDLQALGIEPAEIEPGFLRLAEGEQEIAIGVVGGDDGSFDAVDTVEFFGRAMTTPYARRNIYVLEPGAEAGLRMAERDVSVSGTAPIRERHRALVHAEHGNSLYWQALPNGEGKDHYFWQRLFAGASADFVVDLPHVVADGDDARIRAVLHGRTSLAPNPDHHTRLKLGDTVIDDRTWDGAVPFEHEPSVDPSLLVDGPQPITVELVDDLGNPTPDSLYLDYFEIEYTAELAAVGGELRFVGDRPGVTEYRTSGFVEGGVELYEITDPAAVVRLVGVANGSIAGPGSGVGKWTFEDDTSTPREYLAVAPSARRAPASIELDAAVDLRSAANGADYLVISHGLFLGGLEPLLELRSAEGLRTLAVDVDDVYDAFSGGVYDPRAIRDFLRHAYEHWQPPAPTYVLLVGDANQDYLDHLGHGQPDFLPTHLYETAHYGQFPQDNFFARVSGEDILPDVLLGRLPVRTVAELEAVVAKILAYESDAPAESWNRRALFVADDGEGFPQVQDAHAATLPPTVAASKVYLDEYPSTTAARSDLFAAVEQGAVTVGYVGHGSIDRWAGEGLFFAADVDDLENFDAHPFVSTLNCINGYYAHPEPGDARSKAEEWLLQGGRGAVAMWSPTGLGFLADYIGIGDELHENLFGEGELRIAAATVDAVVTAFAEGRAVEDNVQDLVFFGDPATRLALDLDADTVLDRADNCPRTANADQADGDSDGVGNACDPDFGLLFADGFELGTIDAWIQP